MADNGKGTLKKSGADNVKSFRGKYRINTNIDFRLSPTAKRIVYIFLAALFIIVLVHQTYLRVKPQTQLNTQSAVIRQIYASVDVPAFVVRRESVLPASGGTTVVPCVENGGKVSIGDAVADIYVSEAAASSASKLSSLETLLKYYEGIENVESTNLVSDIGIYNSAVLDSLLSLKKSILTGNLSVLEELGYKFSENLTKRQIIVGKSVDVSADAAVVTAQIEQIKSATGIKSTVTADKSGNFVNTLDGYEGLGSFDEIKKMTYGDVESLLNSQPSATGTSSVGKLITSFVWYAVCNVPEKEAIKLAVGNTVTVTVDGYGRGDIRFKVYAKNENANGYVTLILSNNELNEDLALLRKINIKIHTEEYAGYEIDRKALRTVDGEVGVYVQLGNVVRFKKVDIVYSDDSLVLSKKKEGESGYVCLYDEVIIEGTDLYDGKIID